MDRTPQAAEDLMAAPATTTSDPAELRSVKLNHVSSPATLSDSAESSRRDAWTRVGESALRNKCSNKS